MKKLLNTMKEDKYTEIICHEEIVNDAKHLYSIINKENGENLLKIHFQSGAIKESGVNGIMNEDLLRIVIDRLNSFQLTKFKCRENSIAITKLEEALLWLNKRTVERELRNVEGTHNI